MKRSSIPGSIVFLLAGMVGLGVLHLRSTPKVHAQNGCSAATLQGTYIFMNKADAPGYAHQPGQPTAVAGVRTFDGVGSLFQLATVSIGGTIVRRDSLKGTYT